MTQFTEAYDFRGRTLVDRNGDKIGRFEGLSGCHRSGRSMVMPPQQR